MTPTIIKVVGFNGESEHFINLNNVSRIDLKKPYNCAFYNLYVRHINGDLDIAINHQEAEKLTEALRGFTL